ncbi:MAG: hypothetical protein KC421_30115, partial [Anaerolineales bacterium]|nr:hypothetical protein [Anaerolineales bacterium]
MSDSLTHSSFTYFGVRHHGPGSAWGLNKSLRELKPDLILIEGPADANDLLHWLIHPGLQPPIALLIYRPDLPKRAGTFPFAHFSPEFQALQYGLTHDIPTRFFDLPQSVMLASDYPPQMPDTAVFQQLTTATGYRSYEQWWNVAFEQRRSSRDMFAAILELMQTVRSAAEQQPLSQPNHPSVRLAAQREAHMRQAMRQALHDGHKRIAIVCGAWHTPALLNLDQEEEDATLLADMPAV